MKGKNLSGFSILFVHSISGEYRLIADLAGEFDARIQQAIPECAGDTHHREAKALITPLNHRLRV